MYCNLATVNVAAGNTSYIVRDSVLYNADTTLLLFYPNAKTLSTFTVPNTVDTIGAGAFTQNPNLTSVNIPASVKYIGSSAFYNCYALASVTLSEGLGFIGPGAFRYCNFASITLPESLLGIHDGAFAYNKSLTSITIPANVIDLGTGIVAGCTSLQSIDVASDNAFYSSQNGVLYNADGSQLLMYPVGKRAASFAVPYGVTIIGSGAFMDDTTITSVTLPASVEEISDLVFRGCRNLASINLTNVKILGPGVFQHCGFTSVVIPGGLTTLPEATFLSCQKLDSVTIQEGVTSIGPYAFVGNSNLKSVIIPNSVKTIGERAFSLVYLSKLHKAPRQFGTYRIIYI